MSAEQIRDLRHRLELSRGELAEQVGVAKRTVEYWEQGRGQPNRKAEKILESLKD